MSEQIREQVSAFLDGELPSSETELLLKRLTRDAELRDSFGRYALIGEAMRGPGGIKLSKGFAARINAAIDGEKLPGNVAVVNRSAPRWWKPFAGAAVVAGVAAVAVVALQQRAISPAARLPQVASNTAPSSAVPVPAPAIAQSAVNVRPAPVEPVAYVTPPPSRLTNYVFAHSKYSEGLGRRGVLADLLIEDDEVPAAHAPPPLPARAP